jgi:pimeloyl-ACP methyl ester carboxylesterase
MIRRPALKPTHFPWRTLRRVLIVILVALAALGVYLIVPVRLADSAPANPAAGYAVAIARLEALQAGEGERYNPKCRTTLLTHGKKTPGAVVLVHGNTDCPYQYHQFAPLLYAQGYNVLIAPLPHHGLADRMTDELQKLTAEELVAYANQAIDVAAGLGDQVTVVGISAGGVITAWAAQQRPDLHRAIIISPAFGYRAVPTLLTRPAMRLFLLLPNQFTWWDPVNKENSGLDTTYPRYSTRAMAQYLRLGFAVTAAARRGPPAAASLVVVTNANDTDVNREMIDQVVALWQSRARQKISTYEFPSSLGLQHDLINPLAANAHPEAVYPKLIELIQAP